MTAPEWSEIEQPNTLPDAVQLYLTEIGRVPLLSAAEEATLAEQIARGRAAGHRLESGDDLTPQLQVVIRVDVERGHAAREHLIQANLRLVVSVAKKYTGRGLSFMDLIQEGNIGLMRAVEKFDYTKGHKFSTYAHWWIRQGVTRALAEKSRAVHLPVHVGDKWLRIHKTTGELCVELERDPTIEEISAAVGMSVEQVRAILGWSRRATSLNKPVGGEAASELGDLIVAPGETIEEGAEQSALREDIQRALARVARTDRERGIIDLYFGLNDGRRHTLDEIGQIVGLRVRGVPYTREMMRQDKRHILMRLREELNTMGYGE